MYIDKLGAWLLSSAGRDNMRPGGMTNEGRGMVIARVEYRDGRFTLLVRRESGEIALRATVIHAEDHGPAAAFGDPEAP